MLDSDFSRLTWWIDPFINICKLMTWCICAFLNSWYGSDSGHIAHLIRLAMLVETQVIRSWIVPHFARASGDFFSYHWTSITTSWWSRQILFNRTAFWARHSDYCLMQKLVIWEERSCSNVLILVEQNTKHSKHTNTSRCEEWRGFVIRNP